MREISLTQGKFAIVDDEDYERISAHKWSFQNGGYAVRTEKHGNSHHVILMHRVISGAREGQQVDHIDHNTLDNRKSNIRVCSPSQNHGNRGLNKNNTSGYKGVAKSVGCSTWRAYIAIDYRQISLGSYRSPVEAAMAYDKAAQEYFGEFASFNFQRLSLEDIPEWT